MKVTLKSKTTTPLQESQQFAPLELVSNGQITITHDECAGGNVLFEIKDGKHEKWTYFSCRICGEREIAPLR